ncbi:MAG: DUF1902 domain-containing protein [Spirochaetes bacterium]|nr:DUF1902 domain-containing protein [Spirochaetota bacterium]
MPGYKIKVAFDEEARRWYALNDAIPIALEDDALETLVQRVRAAVPEMLELNGKEHENVQLVFAV